MPSEEVLVRIFYIYLYVHLYFELWKFNLGYRSRKRNILGARTLSTLHTNCGRVMLTEVFTWMHFFHLNNFFSNILSSTFMLVKYITCVYVDILIFIISYLVCEQYQQPLETTHEHNMYVHMYIVEIIF